MVPVCCILATGSEILLIIEATDHRSNFAKTILFRKLFLFFENTFQDLGGISQDISVSYFDSRRSLSSANRCRSTSPILFVGFTEPCDRQENPGDSSVVLYT